MQEITTIGLDLAKSVFQVHATGSDGKIVLLRQLRRAQMLAFFSTLAPCQVWMAPAWQGGCGFLASGRLRPCIRRQFCGLDAARHDEFRVDLVPINGPRLQSALRSERGVRILLSVSLPSSHFAPYHLFSAQDGP